MNGISGSDLRAVYAHKALAQIPRLLGNLDRNEFSPTFGCFHRDYWLEKTSDFPDAVRQFATHAIALVYRHDFPGNRYRGHPKVRDWTIAALDFWARMQHRDGSFDEFYPFERGWVGPTAFTAFACAEAFQLLRDELPGDVAERVAGAISRAAHFVAAGQSEEDHLANHHAMACLAVAKALDIVDDASLRAGFDRLWQGFLGYHNRDEGWSREYDGPDPGYLSATISFLGKVHRTRPDPALLEVLRQSVEFCSYFVYPNGFYAGSMGSRNTLHFYPHGFELLATEIPLAAAVAERMLKGLADGALVPPEIMSDRYVGYRVPEYLQAYLDYTPRPTKLVELPFERAPFRRYFPQARMYVETRPTHYLVANTGKGGVLKVFDRSTGQLLVNDCGILGRLHDGRIVTSQWISPGYEARSLDDGWEVSGQLHIVPSNKLFTLAKNLLFRGALLLLGWNSAFSHRLKAQIRKALILAQRTVPIRFRRRMTLVGDEVILENELVLESDARFAALSFGDEFFVRYVPQSRYFQTQELDCAGWQMDGDTLDLLNRAGRITVRWRFRSGQAPAVTVT